MERYLAGELSHDDISVYAWELADKAPHSIPDTDKIYWSCIFSIIHLADESHFKDGCTQKDLGELLEQLKASQ